MSVPEVVVAKEAICMLYFEQADFFKVMVDSNLQKGRGLKFDAIYANQLAELERNEYNLSPKAQRTRYRSIKVLYQIDSISDRRLTNDGQITDAAKQMAKEYHLGEIAEYDAAKESNVMVPSKQKSSDKKQYRSAKARDDFEDLPSVAVKKNIKRRATVAIEDNESAIEVSDTPVVKKRPIRVKDEAEEDAKRAAKRARQSLDGPEEDEAVSDY